MVTVKITGGIEIDPANLREDRAFVKAPGDNDVYFIFVKDAALGSVRYVGDQSDKDKLEAARKPKGGKK